MLLVWRRSAVFYTPLRYSLQYWIDPILLWVPEVHCFQNKSHRNVLCFQNMSPQGQVHFQNMCLLSESLLYYFQKSSEVVFLFQN